MARPRGAGVESTRTTRHPRRGVFPVPRVPLTSGHEQLSDKTSSSVTCSEDCFPSLVKNPFHVRLTQIARSLVFITKHKWINIKRLYKILTSTKYKALFLYLSDIEYTKQVFFQNIFIGKGLKTILIIHIWSQFCLKKIVGKCT